jgi:hypothetical protein
MAEQQPAQPSPAPAAAPAPAPAEPKGLEKVYKDFNVEAEAHSFQPETPAPQAPVSQPAPVKKYDPFDPNFTANMQSLEQTAARAESTLSQTLGKLNALERQIHQRTVEADLKQAAGKIAEKSGVDVEVAEVAMEARARKDPKFLQIWNNRTKNPKAYEAALDAFSGEMKDKFTVRQDPQLVENQRAVRASQQQMATTTKETDQDKWASMTPQERAQERNRILRMG